MTSTALQSELDFLEAEIRSLVPATPDEPLFIESLIATARRELHEAGTYRLPAFLTYAGRDHTLNDSLLGAYVTTRTVATALGVSMATARRRMGPPDIRHGRAFRWYGATARANIGENIFPQGLR